MDLPAHSFCLEFDPDADERTQVEIAHELTRFHRSGMMRRRRVIDRFMHEPATIRNAARLKPGLVTDIATQLSDIDVPVTAFSEVMKARQSANRADMAGDVSDDCLNRLLSLAVKSQRSRASSVAPDAPFHFRPYPSAGALYPCELYLLRPDKPAQRYEARNHSLVAASQEPVDFCQADLDARAAKPGCAFVITGVPERSLAKYGPRGYRFMLLEAGHLSQNLLLAATATGLPSLVYGTYCDSDLEKIIGLNGVDECVLSVVLTGPQQASSSENQVGA